jgi:hypothetical protein
MCDNIGVINDIPGPNNVIFIDKNGEYKKYHVASYILNASVPTIPNDDNALDIYLANGTKISCSPYQTIIQYTYYITEFKIYLSSVPALNQQFIVDCMDIKPSNKEKKSTITNNDGISITTIECTLDKLPIGHKSTIERIKDKYSKYDDCPL